MLVVRKCLLVKLWSCLDLLSVMRCYSIVFIDSGIGECDLVAIHGRGVEVAII